MNLDTPAVSGLGRRDFAWYCCCHKLCIPVGLLEMIARVYSWTTETRIDLHLTMVLNCNSGDTLNAHAAAAAHMVMVEYKMALQMIVVFVVAAVCNPLAGVGHVVLGAQHMLLVKDGPEL